jgi:hypothetical protein
MEQNIKTDRTPAATWAWQKRGFCTKFDCRYLLKPHLRQAPTLAEIIFYNEKDFYTNHYKCSYLFLFRNKDNELFQSK